MHSTCDAIRTSFAQPCSAWKPTKVMDNLVRAKQGFPILQIDYGGISGTVTDSGTPDVQGSYSDIVAGSITRFILPDRPRPVTNSRWTRPR